jgi:hypothetical protein
MADFKQEMEEQRFQINEQKRELQLLKVFWHVFCVDLLEGPQNLGHQVFLFLA